MKMNEYERLRLENIKRNDEMLAALKIHSKLNDLKRQTPPSKSYKRSPVKKLKTDAPVVLRRSLRARGVPPDSDTAGGVEDDLNGEKPIGRASRSNAFPVSKKSPSEAGPLQMRDAFTHEVGSGRQLVETISRCVKKSQMGERKNEEFESFKSKKQVFDFVDVGELQLKHENIARLVQGRIMNLCFYPTLDMQMIVVGNKFGNLGFWNVNAEEEDDGIYVYHPHPAPISGIVIDPFSISKVKNAFTSIFVSKNRCYFGMLIDPSVMYSSCYDGFIRLMDVEKEVFDMVYSSEYTIYSIALSPHDQKSLYCSEGKGGVNVFDVRAGKSSLLSPLHEDRINTLDFNLTNNNLMATSSTDGTACIWDVRQLSASKPNPLKTIRHKRVVHSAYFSPTGKFLATTSVDNNVGLLSGANYEDTSMVSHHNHTNRWISSFRGIWGWDDSSIFIGNMNRGVDIISVSKKRTIATLESDLMSAIPCRFAAHPYSVGTLAGATSGGQVYIWTLP